jgi:hypothetical protein
MESETCQTVLTEIVHEDGLRVLDVWHSLSGCLLCDICNRSSSHLGCKWGAGFGAEAHSARGKRTPWSSEPIGRQHCDNKQHT